MLGANPPRRSGSLLAVRGRAGPARRDSRPRRHASSSSTRAAPRPPTHADEWIPIRPGTDAALLLAIVHELFARGAGSTSARLRRLVDGLDEVRDLCAPFAPEAVAPTCARSTPTRSAGWRASWRRAEPAAVYGRIGTCTQEFGTLASLARRRDQRPHRQPRPRGRRDVRQPGGVLAHLAAATRPAGGFQIGRWHSRVRGAPEVLGQIPLACLGRGDRLPRATGRSAP